MALTIYVIEFSISYFAKTTFINSIYQFEIFIDMSDQVNLNEGDPNHKGCKNQGKLTFKASKGFSNGFVEVDKDFKIIYSSKEFAELSSLTSKQLIGKDFWEIIKNSKPLHWVSEHRKDLKEDKCTILRDGDGINKGSFEVTFSSFNNGYSIYFKDISGCELVKEEVDQEKDKFSRLFDLSPVPQWVYDVNTLQFLDINEAAIHHYGFSKKEFLKMSIRDIRPKSQLHQLEEIIKTNEGISLFRQSAAIHQTKSGEIKHVKIESNSLIFKGRDARLVLALDFTSQYLAQQALSNSEKRYKALAQNGSDLVAILDHSWNYLYHGPSIKSILDINPEELIGKNAFDFIHLDDKEALLLQLEEFKFSKQIRLSPFRFADGSGQYRWIQTILTDMSDDINIGGIIANSRDISEIIESKIELQKSIERFEIVSKATSDAIWDWDLSTGEIIWNKGIKGIFGYKKLTSNTQWFVNHVHPDDLEQNVVQEYRDHLNEGQSKLTRQYRFKCADGNYKTVLDRSFIIFDSLKKPIRMIGSMQDITHKIEYIEAIEQQNKKLQEISWLQSHSVRAPLARILGLTQLIHQTNNIEQEDSQDILSHLNSSAEELDHVIANIIKTAR